MALTLKRLLLLLSFPVVLMALPSPLPLEEFRTQYRRSDPEDRRCDLVARLGAARDPEAAEPLSRLLEKERSYPCLQCFIVRALCEEGSPAALESVLGVLREHGARLDPCVPLFTRRALGSVQNPKGLAWMTTRAWKDVPELREDILWALARNTAWKDPAFFLDHLPERREKDPRLRAAAAEGLRRLAAPVTAEAVLLSAQIEPSPAVLMRLLPAAGRLLPERALPLLERMSRHPDLRARLGAIEGLAASAAASGAQKIVQEQSLSLLVQILARENGRLRADAARCLEALTGKAFGTDAPEWRTYLQERGTALPAGFQEVGTKAPKHLGVEMPSRRIVFLVEVSQEMVENRLTRQRSERLDKAKKELLKRIDELPPDADFAVVAFGPAVQRWREGISAGTPEARASARAWVKQLAGHGPPDLGAGLQAAWDMGGGEGQADTVVLVASGQPMERGATTLFAGELRYPFALLDWISLQGRSRSVVLHTVGVGNAADKKVLKSLAEATGGTYRAID